MTTSLPWWRTEDYSWDKAVPQVFHDMAGPKGLALVKAWPDGRTDQGWGLQGPKHDPANGFMPRYMRGEFNDRRVTYGYERGKWNFAFIMRSVQLVCIDIDGKNGGLDGAKKLGMLPYTMAETSKSGDGYHLFYSVDEEWDDLKGFGSLGDRIGVEQGVDIRATGCVYHYPTQRWNDHAPAPLPDHLKELILHREQKLAATVARIDTILAGDDDMEVLMLHDEILRDLAKPIPPGKRNVTLFALGNQMRQAQVEGWEDKLRDRGTQVGLDADEVDKIVENVSRYGDNA